MYAHLALLPMHAFPAAAGTVERRATYTDLVASIPTFAAYTGITTHLTYATFYPSFILLYHCFLSAVLTFGWFDGFYHLPAFAILPLL